METIITINPKELNARLLNKIKLFAGNEKGLEIQISIKSPGRRITLRAAETKVQARQRIDGAIEDIEKGKNLIKFSSQEFETLTSLLHKKAS